MKTAIIKSNRSGTLPITNHLDVHGRRINLRKDEECEVLESVLEDPVVRRMLSTKPPWISIRAPEMAPATATATEPPEPVTPPAAPTGMKDTPKDADSVVTDESDSKNESEKDAKEKDEDKKEDPKEEASKEPISPAPQKNKRTNR